MPITVSIVEDAQGVRDGLVRLLDSAAGFHCVASYPNAESALADIPQRPPDVLLMDIDLPGMNGVECVRKLKVLLPEVRVVMLTVYENPEKIFDALSAGAVGYLLKKRLTEDLLEAVQDAYSGGAPMSSQIARKVVQFFQKVPASTSMESLSTRELEVLDLLAKGFLVKEIADKTGLGYGTVRTYIRRIYEKLQVHSRSQAVAKYLQPRSSGTGGLSIL
ncbi:MAG: response regulator transcription factor [Verrucomicrobiota bacterium]|jgi:DNA-binding NarL/FixJ family response regulator